MEERKAMKILWLSRHQPLHSQIAELKRLFGSDTQVVRDAQPFRSAEEIKQRYQQGEYDDLVVVAPLSVMAKLVDLGVKPLWAEMDLVQAAEAEVTANGRGYRFNRFRRVKALRDCQ